MAVIDFSKKARGSALAFYQTTLRLTRPATVAIGSKTFFSEEKKQKTFANSGTCTTRTVRDSN